MKVKKVTTLHSVVHRCCADELYIVRPRPTARITLCPRQYTRPDPSCKGSKTGDGIVSAEVLSCWINPNWQAPLVHQILEPGKGSKHLNSTNDNVWQWQGSEAQVAKVLKRWTGRACVTLCRHQYTRPDPSCKGSEMVDGIVLAEVLSGWLRPNWQAPLVH
jgi:hypothetical protein